jgi:gliding motility-associated-like protein
VERKELFYVPTAFSPNGDGMNDVFRLFPGPAVDRIAALRIFDRWGNLVFQAENVCPDDELAAWNGERNNGRPSAIGVYVYTLEVVLMDGKLVREAGELMVMR